MFATKHYETIILNAFRGQTAQAPSNRYVALFLSNPGEAGTGGVEVSYSGYARKPITFSAPAAKSGGWGIANTADITFNTSAVAAGTVTYLGIMDSLVAGNMLLYSQLSDPIVINAQVAPVIIANEVIWWVTGDMSNAFATRVFNFVRGTNLTGFAPHLSLWNGNPESGGSELAGANYARVPITFTAPATHSTGASFITNTTTVYMNRASSLWGTWTHTVIMDAVTSGTPIYYTTRPSTVVSERFRPIITQSGLTVLIN